ncbi:MAG: hypothetical protein ABIZ91_06455, partial [Gemmatimonadaceae bacterium]
ELMSTRRHQSEESLADFACSHVAGQPGACVLIGGLGFGFTLRASLRLLAPDARVVVAELLKDVIEWNRNPEYALAGDALRDKRVEMRHADVMTLLRKSTSMYDAIMLDVDNGTDPLTTSGNASLYREAGIHMAADALKPGGMLAYWSATADRAFERALRHAGLQVETKQASAHAAGGPRHVLFLARRSASDHASHARTGKR